MPVGSSAGIESTGWSNGVQRGDAALLHRGRGERRKPTTSPTA